MTDCDSIQFERDADVYFVNESRRIQMPPGRCVQKLFVLLK